MKYVMLFFLLVPQYCLAQKSNTATDTIYINKYGSSTYKENAAYYLVWQDKTETKDKVNGTLAKYTPDHQLAETYEAAYYKKQDDMGYPEKATLPEYTLGARRSGISKCFYPSGKLKTVAAYKLNEPDGDYQTYHENGLPESKGRRDRQHNYIYTHTDSNGKEYLSHGSGIISEYNESLKQVWYTEVTDSLMIRAYFIDSGDTIYTQTGEGIEPQKGWDYFYRKLRKLKIPVSQLHPFRGQSLLLECIIMEDGSISRVSNVGASMPGIDKRYIALLSSKNMAFKSPSFRGKPVKMLFRLPVTIWKGN